MTQNSSGLDLVDASAIGQEYVVESKLGEGTYGVVFKAKSRSTGAYVAIKKLRLDGLAEGVPATAIREITLLQDLTHHPNIVHLLQVICRKHRLYLVFELMLEDLRIFVHGAAKQNKAQGCAGSSVLPLPLVRQLTRQMLSALWTCHENRIVHRDLKPGNVLVGGPEGCNGGTGHVCANTPADQYGAYYVKLADFGLARTFELPLCTYTNEVVTLWYRAPEILLGETHYTPAVDVWSVGCIVIEMMTGTPLLRGESSLDQLNKTFALIGAPTEETWPGVTHYLRTFNKSTSSGGGIADTSNAGRRDWTAPLAAFLDADGRNFLQTLLTLDPKQRPNVSEALEHPWLAKT